MHCPDVTLRSIRSHLSHVASLSTYNVFYPFLCSILPLYVCIHFSVSTVTCTFVTCFIKYQSINKRIYTSEVPSAEYVASSVMSVCDCKRATVQFVT